jgi:hypothetical protein
MLLHPLCGFISIKMAKIVVGSPNLTQPLLLYPGLGPAMLEQHRPAEAPVHSGVIRRSGNEKKGR